MERKGFFVVQKSQETGGSRKMVKSRGRDAGMVVGRHEVGRLFDTAFFPGHDKDGRLSFCTWQLKMRG